MDESRQLILFKVAIQSVFEQLSNAVKEDEFLKVMSPIKLKTKVVKKIYQQIKTDLSTKLLQEFEDILSDENMITGMAELTRLLEEAPSITIDKPLWRPPGKPRVHLYSVECEILVNKNKILQNLVAESEARNKDLKKQIIAKRTPIITLIKDIKRLCDVKYQLLELEKCARAQKQCIEHIVNK